MNELIYLLTMLIAITFALIYYVLNNFENRIKRVEEKIKHN